MFLTYRYSHHCQTYNWLGNSTVHLSMSRHYVNAVLRTYARKLSEQFLHASFIVIRHNYGIYCRPWHISANPYTVVKSRYIKSESHIPAVTAHTSRNIHAFSCAGVSATPIMAPAGAHCFHLNHVATQLPYGITVAAVSFVSFIIAGLVQSAVVCMIIAIVLMIATLLVIKAVTAKKHAGVFAEMAEADKVLYNK